MSKQPPGAGAAETPAAHDVDALVARLDRRLGIEATAGPAPEPPPPPAGYRMDAKGRLCPERLVRPQDDLEDQTVRRILAFGVDLADQISRFQQHTYADVAAMLDVLAAEYGGGRRPGRRGNYSLTSYDGRLRVVVQVQDQIQFGPELQAARGIIDDCIEEWADGSCPEIKALMQHAFQPDKQGEVSREAVLRLRRLDIDDERWRQARRAIDDSIRVVGSKVYLRLYLRGSNQGPWRPVPIDISGEWTDTESLEAGLALSMFPDAGEVVHVAGDREKAG